MIGIALDEESDLLPADWLTEGVQEAGCRSIGDGWQLSLRAMPGMRYFGVRLAAREPAAALALGQVSFLYHMVSEQNVAALHLVLREWRQAGSFNFQSQRVLPLNPDLTQAELSLSVREGDMALEPIVLFEVAALDLPSSATLFIDDLRFDVT